MLTLAVVLSALNILCGDVSITGKRLKLSQHPVMIRLRWLGSGMAAALLLRGQPLESFDFASAIAAILLLLSSARHVVKPVAKQSPDPHEPSCSKRA